MKNTTDDRLMGALRTQAQALGFDDVGLCSALPFQEWSRAAWDALRERLRGDPMELMPEARAIVVGVRRYDAFEPWPQGSGEIANYYTASNAGHDHAEALAQWLRERGHQALANPDLPHRAAALRSGLGYQGQNQQFCHEELGVLVSLHLVLTDAPLPVQDAPYRTCEGCGLCVQTCPTGALSEGSFDRLRCLRHHMIGAEAVPLELREAMGARLLGCTECTLSCPHADAQVQRIPEEVLQACGLESLLRGRPEAVEALQRAVGANFARKHRLQAQAALAAGNSGDRSLIPALSEMLREHPSQVARRHSAWALGRLGGHEVEAALCTALEAEKDDAVRAEIKLALAAMQW